MQSFDEMCVMHPSYVLYKPCNLHGSSHEPLHVALQCNVSCDVVAHYVGGNTHARSNLRLSRAPRFHVGRVFVQENAMVVPQRPDSQCVWSFIIIIVLLSYLWLANTSNSSVCNGNHRVVYLQYCIICKKIFLSRTGSLCMMQQNKFHMHDTTEQVV